jgi:hypothetical protein
MHTQPPTFDASQKLFRVSRIHRALPELPRCDAATYWRWATQGRLNSRTNERHVLRTRKIGGALCTCRAWVEEFFDALSEVPGKRANPRQRRPRVRLDSEDAKQAQCELARRGL